MKMSKKDKRKQKNAKKKQGQYLRKLRYELLEEMGLYVDNIYQKYNKENK